MNEEMWKLVPYDCQDGDCLMLWNIGTDSKLGALSLDHRDIGEGIVEELNKLENYNRDVKDYIEKVEEVNEQLKIIRDNVMIENKIIKIENKDLRKEISELKEYVVKLEKDLRREISY